MTSPDPKSTQNAGGESGGMLPALLAGAGILAVAALFIFNGDDDATKDAAQKGKDVQAHSSSAQSATNPKGGVAARRADEARNNGTRPQPRLNPRIANAIVTEGMAPTPNKKPEPTSWDSVNDEIVYWETQLTEANRMLEMRERASAHVPKQEEKIRERGTPEDLAEFQGRKAAVATNLERAQARVAEVQGKLTGLRGG